MTARLLRLNSALSGQEIPKNRFVIMRKIIINESVFIQTFGGKRDVHKFISWRRIDSRGLSIERMDNFVREMGINL